MSVGILDTTVFCNLLRVPGRDQDHTVAVAELEEHLEARTTLLLPLAAIYETGNHIAQVSGGAPRRRTAERFVDQVTAALDGRAPWSPTDIPDLGEHRAWLDAFPDHATRGVGLGDLSIIRLFHKQCELHRARRVFVWSYDHHLASFDRRP